MLDDDYVRSFKLNSNETNLFFSLLQALTDEMLTELKSCFLEAYDDNQDGKIDIRELAQLLPMEENFLLLFRFDNPLDSSVEFMKIWREYDSDNSGYIEADELKVNIQDSSVYSASVAYILSDCFRRISFAIFWKKLRGVTTYRKTSSLNIPISW